MELPLLLVLPLVAAGLTWVIGMRAPRLVAPVIVGLPLVALVLLLQLRGAVFDQPGDGLAWRVSWLPALGLDLSLRLDGLAYLFALLVVGVGLLVILYARYYLARNESAVRFFCLLLLFMAAMLGVVLAGNLLLLAVFWELTSILSFLLIGFWSWRGDARQGARMALTVTGGGGLALLAGVLLLGHMCGSFELSAVLAQAGSVQRHPLYMPMLVLILLAVFTKSAQFPFSFWLPQAMAAPTPVSAYLHSATMVKAGVFLLARLYPVLDGTNGWFYLVSMTGLATLIFGAAMALLQRDLKGLLAYSTISHLGLITLLFGLDTQLSTVAAIFHIINHAVFKASLFMAAGIIDHETGTRDLDRLHGLARYMPHTAVLAIVASLSMAGVPLFNGFLSKEMFFGETLAQGLLGDFNWVIPAAATMAGALTMAYSLRFIYGVFFGGRQPDVPNYPPHEPPRFMKVPVEFLVVICLVVGLVPAYTVGTLLAAASLATLRAPLPAYSLNLWHGVNLPLVMSLLSMTGGAALFFLRRDALRRWQQSLEHLNARRSFESGMRALERIATALTRTLERGSLPGYIAWMLLALLAIPAWFLADLDALAGTVPAGALDPLGAAALAILAVLALAVVAARGQRLAALVLLGGCGLMVSLVFLRFSAPDLALTQLSVEVVTVLLLVLALFYLPRETAEQGGAARRTRDVALALGGGTLLAVAAYAVMTRPYDPVSAFYIEQAVPGGGGHNVVNVLLVDFRGFDTMGEICVLLIAGLAVQALLKGMRLPTPSAAPDGLPWTSQAHPLLLAMLARLMLPLTLLVAVFILLRGHNLPGGGFIAALITSVALLLQYVANGVRWTEARIAPDYRAIAGAGILLAGLTGLGSLAFGYPFLTTAFGHFHLPGIGEIELATAMIFDLGVFCTVTGTTLVIVSHLGVRNLPPARAEEED
ncbi:monovalent cation/H+ antiporter subunit A [Cupriavidus consociatus]|uniref:monovalent cation/H+ antiporter subunit A n=1 Tax=Cupriavidus consociatus TaxID=2821357 RepID=UPI001AE7FF55|nr:MULTISPECIES: monovalent cation/H+ antiporter subunit A [unclassified Cupriavidus]MBP0618846.1 monovalent cation/H+ antiporter subunit A [Cupriavidus sp. LEh25]MDK2655487.1 monovalent cation/H+ antiporter subunit A [Cupriavidus sp. LEh21]